MKLQTTTLLTALVAGLGLATTSDAAITYFDATTINTSGATIPTQTTAATNNNGWVSRTGFGNGGNVIAASANNDPVSGETTPELTTVINAGLTAGLEYDVYAYFWTIENSSGRDWDIQAGLSSGSLTSYNIVLANATNLSTNAADNTSPADESITTNFTSSVLVSEGNRRLFQAYLGTAVANGSDEISVFINDFTGNNHRTWYDGVGYEVVPEPSSLALLGLGGLCMLKRRRRD